MKLKTIPHEYEAIQFNGITQEVEDFLYQTDATLHKNGSDFVLSNIIGNHGINIGDYLCKYDAPLTMVRVVHNDHLLKKYFEVVE